MYCHRQQTVACFSSCWRFCYMCLHLLHHKRVHLWPFFLKKVEKKIQKKKEGRQVLLEIKKGIETKIKVDAKSRLEHDSNVWKRLFIGITVGTKKFGKWQKKEKNDGESEMKFKFDFNDMCTDFLFISWIEILFPLANLELFYSLLWSFTCLFEFF